MRALVLSLVFLFALPSVAEANKKLHGTWKLVGVMLADGPVPKEKLAGGTILWKFAKDGTMAITVTAGDQTKTSAGTWTVEDDQLTTVEGAGVPQKMTWRVKGKTLKLKGADGKVTLEMKKQK